MWVDLKVFQHLWLYTCVLVVCGLCLLSEPSWHINHSIINYMGKVSIKICIYLIIWVLNYSGVFGSGVCIFSRHIVENVFFHQWPVNGYIHKLHHGDWFGGKGVGLCRVKCKGISINIYSAHVSTCIINSLKL